MSTPRLNKGGWENLCKKRALALNIYMAATVSIHTYPSSEPLRPYRVCVKYPSRATAFRTLGGIRWGVVKGASIAREAGVIVRGGVRWPVIRVRPFTTARHKGY